jgi:hypothetical protein
MAEGRADTPLRPKEPAMPDPELVTALSKLLATLPGVIEEKTEKHATFLINKKVFAFTRSGDSGGVAIKLPKERIAELLPRKEISPLTMGKRTMKEWILLDHVKSSGYKKDLALFKEAISFVSSRKVK